MTPENLAALKTELQTDPNAYGYVVSPITPAVCDRNASLINEIRNTILVDRVVIRSHEIVSAIVPADWTALSAAERERISLIISAGEVNVQSANVRNAFLTAFGPGTTTRTNLAAIQQRQGSRADALFGFAVSSLDVLNALSS